MMTSAQVVEMLVTVTANSPFQDYPHCTIDYVDVEYDVFLLVTQAYSDKVKKNPSAPNRSRTYDLPISTSDALPLSYRRLVVARPLN